MSRDWNIAGRAESVGYSYAAFCRMGGASNSQPVRTTTTNRAIVRMSLDDDMATVELCCLVLLLTVTAVLPPSPAWLPQRRSA